MRTIGAHIYMILLAIWVGGIFLFTFVVTPVLFRSYGRDTAGEIVGRLFPTYFLFCIIISALSLLLFFLSFADRTEVAYKISLSLLALAVLISLYLKFSLYPEIVTVKKAVPSFESASPDDPVRKKFGSLHAKSAALNLVMFADGLTLLVVCAGLKRGPLP